MNGKIRRALAVLLCFALAAACLAGCTKKPAGSADAGYEAQVTTGAEQTSAGEGITEYPLTVSTYNFNKEKVEYTIEKTPERVWAQNQNNIEVLLKLGLADRIVGACGLDGEVAEELKDEFAKINYYESMPTKEEIIALSPDFISGWYSTFEDKRLGDVPYYHERNIGTYMSLNSACQGPAAEFPRCIANEIEDILTLGRIFDKQTEAQAIADGIQSEIDRIEAYISDNGIDRLSIAMLEDEGGTYRVYGADTLGGDVAVAGGAQLAVGEHGRNENISAEDLVAIDPDAIFVVWYEGYSVNGVDYSGEECVKLFTENPAFASLKAVQGGKVFPINLRGIYCSGLHTIDGIMDVSTKLYPELYK